MVYQEQTKAKGWLNWQDPQPQKTALDVEEIPLQLGESVLRIVDNPDRKEKYERGYVPTVPFNSGQAMDAETWDGINVRKTYRRHTKDLLGAQVNGAEVGRL